jgi:type IV pilus assembly protein PilQ
MTLQRERPKFLAAVLGAATLVVWSIPAFAETVRVRNIQVSETAGNTAVVIAASAKPTFTTWKLEQPARVVVELSGARLGNVDVPLDAGTFAVGLVSASVTEDDSAGPRTRIVLTLRQISDYQVEAKGNDITLRVIPRARPPIVGKESTEARLQVEARTKAEAQARNEAQAKERAEAQVRTLALAKAEAQAQAKAEALAKAEAQAQVKAEALAKAEAQAQVKAEALAKAEAQTQARAESLAKTEAQAQAKAEARAKTEAQAQAKAEARAKTEAQAQAKAEALAKSEAQAQAKAEALAKSEALAQAKAEALAKSEALARAEAQAKLAAQAKADAQERTLAQRKTEALLKDESKGRLAAQAAAQEHSRAEAAAKLEADRLRKELANAHRETAKAKAEASAANEESQRQKHALTQAESQVRQAQSEAERARQRADSAESEAAEARRRETERDKALRLAAEEVDSRQKTLDRIAQKQAEQQGRLVAAERLVSERDSAVRDSASRLAEREEESRAARARRDSLARDASKSSKAEAAAALAEAERQRKNAASAAEQSRQELTQAVASRRQEEARKDEQANLRQAEENRLDKAVAQRKAEELRLAEARAERFRLDQERTKLESERAQLETTRNALLAEVNRLKTTVSATMNATAKAERTIASVPAPAPKPAPVASVPAPAPKPAPVASVTAPAAKPAPIASVPAPTAKPAPIASVPVQKPAPIASVPAPTAKPAPIASASVAKTTPVATLPAARSLAVAIPAVPAASPASTGRPRSVTLRALSHIRSIDFVDEPNRASVIIDVDDTAMFTVERVAGRRLSLRIEHSDLPENLARNLDATEYLGPVKIISSYRDPAVRSTVRVDVDLAEDVPNRVRLDGNRIFWDFQKARAPSLPAVWVPPASVMFVPAQKVAGFVAIAKDGLWVGQMAPLPYLAPPSQSVNSAPAGDTSALPAGPVAPAGAAPEGRQGSSTGGSGRFATIGKKRYTGRRIDLDFKGADIHNILRLLADVGQVNVIVADDVRGEVTIKMRDVPWDQALDVVLRSKGLGSVREGNLLRVAPLALLEKELEAEIARQKQIADVLPIETRLIGVSYAEANQLIDKIRDLLSPRGKVSEDHRTNTLIVSDVTKNLQLIEDLVRNLDTQTAQVTIEARIVEANSNFSRQIGVQWGGTAFADTTHGNPTGLVFPYNVGIGGGADDGSSPLGGLVPGPRTGSGTTGSPNFLVNMPAPAGLGTGSAIGLTLGSVAGAFNLNLRLSAMESTGAVRILSSPRITTMDNVQANIEQGVSIPVSVVSAMGAQTQFVDAKLTLSVKPHVTNEGTISMVINVTRNEPDFVNTGARGDPSIQKKEAKTTMLVRDGDTAVIGGIYTRNTGLSNARVPFFSDIPVLGWFFRNRKENDNRSEFLVFITPRIVNRPRVAGQ